ncbi:MAG: hypothetical protein AAF561_08630 [Planctomycetota bacterium]
MSNEFDPSFTRWLHVTLTTRNSWLHGDPRGFRDKEHRLHSSGDYRNRPPAGEHASVHAFYRSRSDGVSPRFDDNQRIRVCDIVVDKLVEQRQQPVVVAVVSNHLHFLARFPDDRRATNRLIGQVKRRVTRRLDGSESPTFSQGAGIEVISDRSHQEATLRYIRDKQGSDAAVWVHGTNRPGATLRSALGFG